jgi:hypothetical protein
VPFRRNSAEIAVHCAILPRLSKRQRHLTSWCHSRRLGADALDNSVVVPECCSELRQPSAGLRSFADRGNPITTSDAGTRIIATQ